MSCRYLHLVILLLLGTPTAFGATIQTVQAEAQGLVLSLRLGSRNVPHGHPVTAVLALRNKRPTPITLIIAQGPFDLVVYNATGTRQWMWTQSRAFPLTPPEQRLVLPGATITTMLVWDQTILRAPLQIVGKASPAAYSLQGVLHAAVVDASELQLRTPLLSIAIRP